MSIEKLLEENTAAMRELTEVTKTLIGLRTEAIETVKNAAAPASPKKADKKADDKPKEEPKAAAKDEDADETAYDEAKSLVASYTQGSQRPEEVQARKAKIKELLRHEKLVRPEMAKVTDKFSVTDVMEDKIGVLVKNLKALIERGDLTEPASADADDDLV